MWGGEKEEKEGREERKEREEREEREMQERKERDERRISLNVRKYQQLAAKQRLHQLLTSP